MKERLAKLGGGVAVIKARITVHSVLSTRLMTPLDYEKKSWQLTSARQNRESRSQASWSFVTGGWFQRGRSQ